jgi:transcription factor C subunit 7
VTRDVYLPFSFAHKPRFFAKLLGIAEWYSPVEPGTGLHPRPSSATALKAYFSEIDDSWSSVWYPTRKGEDLNALLDRLTGFVSVFVPEIHRRFTGSAAHKRILFVGHAATVIGLAQAWVGDRNISFRAACCSLTVLDCKSVAAQAPSTKSAVVGGAGGDWTVRILGGGDHLKEGLQRDWGLEDIQMANGEVSQSPYFADCPSFNLVLTWTFGTLAFLAGDQAPR